MLETSMSSPRPNPPSRQESLASIRTQGSTDSFVAPDEVVTTEGLKHCDLVLNPKKYKKEQFLDTLLEILQKIRVPGWSVKDSSASINSNSSQVSGVPNRSEVKIFKVSGSLTNAVFFISAPNARTVLLRVYGPSSGALISRPAELRILHILSSEYRIGPRVYGTFGNGRVEEFFESDALTAADLRNPEISQWIAIRMAELHRVDVHKVADPEEWADPGDGTRGELGIKRNLKTWIPAAQKVVDKIKDEEYTHFIDFAGFVELWGKYYKWVRDWEKKSENRIMESPRVFCHNDTQYGNLLRLRKKPAGRPDHHQIIVVDFEYGSPNPAAFDIGNHFQEWTANYHDDQPAVLYSDRYPTRAERDNFYKAYIEATATLDWINLTSAATSSGSIDSPADGIGWSSNADTSLPGGAATPTNAATPNSSQIQSQTGSSATSTSTSTTNVSVTSTSTVLTPAGGSASTGIVRRPSLISIESSHRISYSSKAMLTVTQDAVDKLEEQVTRWAPASHALWAVWALVQAKEQVEAKWPENGAGAQEETDVEAEFDYLTYARCRFASFREQCKALGVE